jgi:hypothetical protein
MSSSSSEPSYTKLDSGVFQCCFCDKQCAKQNTMYYHVQSKHLQEFKYSCTHCEGKQFVQKSAYLQHMAINHPTVTAVDENPYMGVTFACTDPGCDQTFKTKANMLVHFARSHCQAWIPAYNKGICCKGCSKEQKSSTAYFYHALTCIPGPTGVPVGFPAITHGGTKLSRDTQEPPHQA